MMITQAQQSLTEMNRFYFHGQITYEDYKNKRGLLLDSLFEDITVRNNNNTQTTQTPSSATDAPVESSSSKLIYIVVALLICVALLITLFLPNDESPQQPATQTTEVKASNNYEQIQALIETSITNNIWSTDKINEINSLWSTLSADEIAKARKSHWYPRLTGELMNLISEQQALVDLGNQNAAEFEQQINTLLELINQQ